MVGAKSNSTRSPGSTPVRSAIGITDGDRITTIVDGPDQAGWVRKEPSASA
jgi:bifunctional DNA-binding transcriptional regulator/antitoxin component of YhaV-PrlF toxin-antitoxin module